MHHGKQHPPLNLNVIPSGPWEMVTVDMIGPLPVSNGSTAYHPQTDRQTESVNKELEQYLWIFVNHRQDDQVNWLDTAMLSYNDKIHSSTGHTPFCLDNS